MKVFMSWSGQRSKVTAELLYEWIKCVIQAAQPWISSKGIERGALWFSEINNELKDTSIGIVCITQENKDAPWILFEAGALAKGLSSNRVCTLLVDLKPTDLQPPLSQFNHTFPEKSSMWSLVTTLNNSLEVNRLDIKVLERVFETYWPQFETQFDEIIKTNPPTTIVPPRKDKDILSEILETTRSISNRVSNLEMNSNTVPTTTSRNIFRAKGVMPSPSPSKEERLIKDVSIEFAVNQLRNNTPAEIVLDNLKATFGMSDIAALEVLQWSHLTASIKNNNIEMK